MKKVFTILIIVSISIAANLNLDLKAGWNMITVPYDSIYSSSFSSDVVIDNIYNHKYFGRDGWSYVPSDTLDPSKSYWFLSSRVVSMNITGTETSCFYYDTLFPGWNMVGVPASPVDIDSFVDFFGSVDIINPQWGYNTDTRGYEEAPVTMPTKGLWLLTADTIVVDTCMSNNYPSGSPLWTVEIDSAAQYYRNISSPSLDEDGNVYFSEHRDYDTTDTVSDDTDEYFSEYKFNSSGSMLWSVNISENAHFKHNPTPVIDIDRGVSYCATGPYCFVHFIDSGDICDSIVYIGQGHYVGDPAIDCEHFHLSRFNAHGRGAPINTSSRIEMYNFSSYTVIDTFSTNTLEGDLDFRIVTGPVIDHNGRIIFGANKIDGGDDSLHLDPCMVISVDVVSDAFVFVDSINAGTFAKYSSFALDTNSSGNTRIYAGSMDGSVYAFLDEGDSLHKLFEIGLGGTINSNPVINNDGIMYVGSAVDSTLQNGRLWALDIDSLITLGGTLDTSYAIWHYPDSGFLEGGIYGSPTIGDDGVIYFGETEGEGYLYAISDHGDSAHFEWRYRRDSLDNIRCCPIVSKDGIVYYTSKTYDEPKFYLNCEVIFA